MEDMKEWAGSAVDMSRDVSKSVGEYLGSLKKMVNKRLNAFSRIHMIFEQKEPFEKTPTRKIKRYLYTSKDDRTSKDNRKEDHSGEKD